jgi:hypothetical protein
MAPDKIYVREYPDGLNQFWDNKKRDDVVATIHHEYIRKDALLEWLKKKKSQCMPESMAQVYFQMFVDKLNSM